MTKYLFVAMGGALGAVLRFSVSNICSRTGQPTGVATLIVNVVGSFCMALLLFKYGNKHILQYFFTIGLLGAFTTFSTFSFEAVNMLRQLQYLQAFLYVTLNFVLALLAVVSAFRLSLRL